MARSIFRWTRLCTIGALVLVLAPQALTAHPAVAQSTGTPALFKAVCNLSTNGSGTCPTTTTTTTTTATPGQLLQYNLNFNNNTGTTATIFLTDQLQAGQTFVSCDFAGGTPPGATCTPTTGGGAAPLTVTATIPNVAAGSGGTVDVRVTYTGSSTSVTNQFMGTATTANGTTFSNQSNVTTVNPTPASAGLTVSKAVANITRGGGFGTNITAAPGDRIRYQITVTNNTGTTATGVTITDPLQAGQVAEPGTCTQNGCYFTGSTVVFQVGNLGPTGQTAVANRATVQFDANISATTCGAVIPDQATASASNAAQATSNTTTTSLRCGQVSPCTSNICSNPCGFNTCSNPCGFNTCSNPCGFSSCGNPCAYSCRTGSFPVVCGTVYAFQAATVGTTGFTTLNGTTYVVPAGTTFGSTVVTAGGTFCFLLSPSNFITGCLSAIPIAAKPMDGEAGAYRIGRMRAS